MGVALCGRSTQCHTRPIGYLDEEEESVTGLLDDCLLDYTGMGCLEGEYSPGSRGSPAWLHIAFQPGYLQVSTFGCLSVLPHHMHQG